MVVDTSALVAIEQREPDAAFFEMALATAGGAAISAVTLVEFNMVTLGPTLTPDVSSVDEFVRRLNLTVMNVSEQDAILARDAFLRYGKGRHPARLNFGDCFSYALAKRLGEPLLFKGNDFAQTDVLIA